MNLNGKRVLVTGGTGMIGRALVDKLKARECKISTISMDTIGIPGVDHHNTDLTKSDRTERLFKALEPAVVFHLAGIKGSPKLTATQPSTFFVNTILFNTLCLEAIRKCKPEWALYTSSVGVYAPAEVFKEDTVWSTLPSPYDKFAGYAKRMGELQIEGYAIEYGLKNFSIIRPSNVYGKFDNFNPETSMVVPATISKAFSVGEEMVMWGDGSPVRDFVYSKQIADQMIWQVENEITEPLNGGSGASFSIKEMAEEVLRISGAQKTIKWDTTKPSGDKFRTMDMSRVKELGFEPTYNLKTGLTETINWYLHSGELGTAAKRYDAFKEAN